MTNLVYQKTAAELRRRITTGSYSATAGLPTEAQLCADLKISRSSIRKALQLLRSEGLLISRQGSGWSVAPTVPHARIQVHNQGDSTSKDRATLELVGHSTAIAPEAVADALDKQRLGGLLLIERVSKLKGVTIHRSATWFSKAVSSSIDTELAATQPPARLLSEHGYRISRFDQYAEATLANSRDEALLGLAPGAAVLQVVRTAFDPTNNALFQSRHRHPGASSRIDVDLPTTDEQSGDTVILTATS